MLDKTTYFILHPNSSGNSTAEHSTAATRPHAPPLTSVVAASAAQRHPTAAPSGSGSTAPSVSTQSSSVVEQQHRATVPSAKWQHGAAAPSAERQCQAAARSSNQQQTAPANSTSVSNQQHQQQHTVPVAAHSNIVNSSSQADKLSPFQPVWEIVTPVVAVEVEQQ